MKGRGKGVGRKISRGATKNSKKDRKIAQLSLFWEQGGRGNGKRPKIAQANTHAFSCNNRLRNRQITFSSLDNCIIHQEKLFSYL